MDARVSGIGLRRTARILADLSFPRTCIVCGRALLPTEEHVCLCCEADLPSTYFGSWERNPMADALNFRIGSETYEPYAHACALFYYNQGSGYSRITRALKYGRNFAAGRYFAARLGSMMAESGLYADVDAVVSVPLHWTRRVRRGYNQAEVIARELSRELEAPLCPGLLGRRRRTRSQTTMDAEGKRLNVRGAFVARRVRECRHILVVDDVCTTGSTLSECYLALRKVFGPEVRISAAVLAYVE